MTQSGGSPILPNLGTQRFQVRLRGICKWLKRMAPQVGLEATIKRKRKDLQSTDGNESTSKAMVIHVN